MNIEFEIRTEYITLKKDAQSVLLNIWKPIRGGKSLVFDKNWGNKYERKATKATGY